MILKYVVALVLIGHGIGHLTGVLAAFATGAGGFSDKPWLFSRGVTVRGPTGKLWSVVWLLATIAFVAAGIALLVEGGGWPWLPVAAALLSLLAVVPWWPAVVPGARAGAALDVLVLLALLPGWREQVMAALGAG